MLVYTGAQINNIIAAESGTSQIDGSILQETTPNGAFNNAGTLEKTGATGTSDCIVCPSTTTLALGTVTVSTGTLSFSEPQHRRRSFSVATGDDTEFGQHRNICLDRFRHWRRDRMVTSPREQRTSPTPTMSQYGHDYGNRGDSEFQCRYNGNQCGYFERNAAAR